ncbi:MAG: DUF5320 domain-containing protein [Clostridiales bacterium]|nr:DUF5320 domain-containing protein [Clostridiales bacterium]
MANRNGKGPMELGPCTGRGMGNGSVNTAPGNRCFSGFGDGRCRRRGNGQGRNHRGFHNSSSANSKGRTMEQYKSYLEHELEAINTALGATAE